jgi:hypothetical protein
LSRIRLDEIFRRAIDVVEAEGTRYLVYGGIALPFWGRVTATDDVDLVVQVADPGVEKLFQAFRGAGFYVPPAADNLFLVDTWTVASMGGRDVDLALGATEFDEEALRRAVRVRVFAREAPIATAEDLILYKLVAHRRRDLGHIEDIITRQGRKLDLAYLRKWSERIAESTRRFEVPGVLDRMLSEQGL